MERCFKHQDRQVLVGEAQFCSLLIAAFGPDNGILQIDVPWAREGAGFTFLFEYFAMTMVREMPVNRVPQIINVDDNKLWRMMHYYTDAARQKEDYSGVKQIGVDETSKAKGHDYVSLFVDLGKKRTIFVAEGKGSETMAAFTEDFKEHHDNPHDITDVSIDMSPAFIIRGRGKPAERRDHFRQIPYFNLNLPHIMGLYYSGTL